MTMIKILIREGHLSEFQKYTKMQKIKHGPCRKLFSTKHRFHSSEISEKDLALLTLGLFESFEFPDPNEKYYKWGFAIP